MELGDFIVELPAPDPACAPWGVSEAGFPAAGSLAERVAFALGYAVLAPSIANTQPWRWRLSGGTGAAIATLGLDRDRVLARADADARAATISCGAALELLDLALARFGIARTIAARSGPDDLAVVTCTDDKADPPPPEELWMFQAIPKRRSSREPLAGRPPSAKLVAALEAAAAARGAALVTFAPGDPRRPALVEIIEDATAAALADRAWVDERAAWIADEGTGRRDGQRPHPGAPTFACPGPDGEPVAARGPAIDRGSPLLALITTPADDRQSRLAAGRALARVLLRGRVDHVWASFFGPPVERDDARARLGELVGGNCQVALRLGHGGDLRPSPRRPLAEVLERGGEV